MGGSQDEVEEILGIRTGKVKGFAIEEKESEVEVYRNYIVSFAS